MTVHFIKGEGEAAISKKYFLIKIIYQANRRFSLSTNILACHSERSEESPATFAIYLNEVNSLMFISCYILGNDQSLHYSALITVNISK